MPDVFTIEKRSAVMSVIRSRGNKDTELRLISIFRAYGITGWRINHPLHGRPDFVFRSKRLAIFVDGCFWHGCPKHGRKPTSNQDYWIPKLLRNQARDRQVTTASAESSGVSLRLWEHHLLDPAKTAALCNRALEKRGRSLRPGQKIR